MKKILLEGYRNNGERPNIQINLSTQHLMKTRDQFVQINIDERELQIPCKKKAVETLTKLSDPYDPVSILQAQSVSEICCNVTSPAGLWMSLDFVLLFTH